MIELGGDLVLEADVMSFTLHRRKMRENKKTGATTPYLDMVSCCATIAQMAARLTHMSGAEAVAAGKTVAEIKTAIEEAAARIEQALINTLGEPITAEEARRLLINKPTKEKS